MEEVTQTMYGLSIQLVLVSPEHAKLKTLQQGCTTQAIAALDPIASLLQMEEKVLIIDYNYGLYSELLKGFLPSHDAIAKAADCVGKWNASPMAQESPNQTHEKRKMQLVLDARRQKSWRALTTRDSRVFSPRGQAPQPQEDNDLYRRLGVERVDVTETPAVGRESRPYHRSAVPEQSHEGRPSSQNGQQWGMAFGPVSVGYLEYYAVLNIPGDAAGKLLEGDPVGAATQMVGDVAKLATDLPKDAMGIISPLVQV
ncbi:hypothetical protein NQ176_g2656 [Zarea fungicola]|uniref:Uncharacterized protein n=1 Tax=Zarea fungicola TaxID=93591 RepID=A0ACC1NP88_9HYPO|nr:hypothetical protein NQ176_g2656 [Lecanicillium fungicola]